MITKEQFLDRCTKLYPEYDFSNMEWVSYTIPIHVLCNKHGDFEIIPRKLYQQRGKCKLCSLETLSQKNSDNAKERLEKAKQTNLEKYGVENPFQSNEVKQKIKKISIERHGGIGTASPEIAKKIAATKEERYGDSTFTNREKCKKTVQERYGVDNVYASQEVLEKKKKTYLDRYGVDNPLKSKKIREKIKKTNKEKYGCENPTAFGTERYKQSMVNKYGVDNPYQIPKVKEKCLQNLHSDESDKARKQTCLEHFGVTSPLLIPEVVVKAKQNSHTPEALRKQKQTNLDKYGVESAFQREDVIEKTHSEEAKLKRRKTLHKNGTYGKSQAEDRCYNLLQSIFTNAIHHYTSDVYPFECDMYVPELDLYIELNFFWTHGGHFFDSTNLEDMKIVEEWKSKNTDFYNAAVENWTVRDLKKLETAKKNNLNYFVCWTEDEFMAVFDRDFSMHEEIPSNITNVTQVAKIANWTEYFKREIEILKEPAVLGELFINRYKYLGKLPNQLSNLALLNGLSISGKLRKYSTFDNCGMVQFIEKYQPASIYDPCAGWGERLLTCHQYHINYFGVDINSKTIEGLNTLIDAYNIDATVLCKDSSQVDSNTCECLFTCPPYWNTEIYTKQGAENLSYEDFLSWWKTVIHKSNCNLVAYQINQKFKKDMNQQLLDLGYSFIEEIVLPQKSSHFTRKDGNRKKEYESIQVFIKK